MVDDFENLDDFEAEPCRRCDVDPLIFFSLFDLGVTVRLLDFLDLFGDLDLLADLSDGRPALPNAIVRDFFNFMALSSSFLTVFGDFDDYFCFLIFLFFNLSEASLLSCYSLNVNPTTRRLFSNSSSSNVYNE